MVTVDEKATRAQRHCANCGQAVPNDTPAIERFGEQFCSAGHADEFTASVRAARIEAAARTETPTTACAMAPGGTRSWTDYLKKGACWGAPLLLLLAIPLFWSGNAVAATGGSLLSVLALIACPLGMFFMMRAMGGMNHGGQAGTKPDTDPSDRRGH